MNSVAEARRLRRRGAVPGWRDRLLLLLLTITAHTLRRLPDRLLHRAADLVGRMLYRLQPARRRLVRENLTRVCRWLVEHDMANAETAAAARDGRALDRLTRAAFGHYVRVYLEGAILPVYGTAAGLERVEADDQSLAAQAFPPGRGGPLIIVGLHFGAIEIPGLWASKRLGIRITAPMETLDNIVLQAYQERRRGETGMNVVQLEGAATELRRALEHDETVALVADRPIGGSGTPVTLFGAPARLPAGPAVLALESGAPVWLIVTRRTGWGEYRSRLERIEMPPGDARRERWAGYLEAQARAFERAIADAPEQWWTVFFPIWESP